VPLKVREIERALTTKGFKKAENDHHFYFYYHEGKKTAIRTKISHGETEVHDRNCGLMARQIKLTSPQFREFVDCGLTKEKYLAQLISAHHIELQPKEDQAAKDAS
jgi:hypothetical protein